MRQPRLQSPLTPFVRMSLAVLVALSTALAVAVPAHAASDQRHYELASPADKAGQAVAPNMISADGGRVRSDPFSENGLPGFESQMPFNNSLLMERGATRWLSLPMNASATTQKVFYYNDSTPDLGTQLSQQFTRQQDIDGASQLFLRTGSGPFVAASPVLRTYQPADGFSRPEYQGSSPDFSQIVVTTRPFKTLLPTDPVSGIYGSVYAIDRSNPAAPVVRNLASDDHGNALPGAACLTKLGGQSGAHHAIADDGHVIFFTLSLSGECGGGLGLLARSYGENPIELSAPECSACSPTHADPTYQDASVDGYRVFFTTDQPLTDSDTDTTTDLYEYDFDRPAGHHLRLVSAGGVGDATPGSGASVLGLEASSDDGNRLYFVAQGVLTTQPNGQGQSAASGANNLYRWDAGSGETTFVTALDPADNTWQYGAQTARIAGDGDRYLMLTSLARLTPDDTDSTSDIYRYDAESGALERVSIGRDGYGDNGNSDVFSAWVQLRQYARAYAGDEVTRRQVSADGSRIVFTTSQALQPQDANGRTDVYEWHDGQVGLVSTGKDPLGTAETALISADGRSIAFATSEALVPSDTDTAVDAYVARTGDDFPPPPPAAAAPCTGDICQGTPGGRSGDLIPGTVTFSGAGNVSTRDGTRPEAGPPSKLKVTTPKAASGTSITVAVKAPAKGRLTLSGVGLRTVTSSASAGTRRLKVHLTARAASTLKKKHRYITRAKVVFTPAGGPSHSATVSLTFTAPSTTKGR